MSTSAIQREWAIDQLAKSAYFHEKLHQWGMMEVAAQIEAVKGETLIWDRGTLQISDKAWNKVIHRGIKPITVFAHPTLLMQIPRAVSYYRMLSTVSQKSMARVGLSVNRYETGKVAPAYEAAAKLAAHLNQIICNLIEADEELDPDEFAIWRGMAAGSQAQGSWGNSKGTRIEDMVRDILLRRVRERGLVVGEGPSARSLPLQDGRTITIGDEPDFAIYRGGLIENAVEIKGGIDSAGVLERIGAAVKSLGRARRDNPDAITILLIMGTSMSQQAYDDLAGNRNAITHHFLIEDFVDNDNIRQTVFSLLGL